MAQSGVALRYKSSYVVNFGLIRWPIFGELANGVLFLVPFYGARAGR